MIRTSFCYQSLVDFVPRWTVQFSCPDSWIRLFLVSGFVDQIDLAPGFVDPIVFVVSVRGSDSYAA